jgi:polysaccharide export outer membrane protein
MPLRFVFIIVSAAGFTFAQSEAPAPPGAAAKVTLPATPSAPPPSDAAAAQPAQTETPAPAADPTPAVPKPAAESPAAETAKPTVAQAPSAKPTKAEKSSGHKPYVFGALDVVSIKIYNQPNLSGYFPISSDGFISIPIVGDIKADGLTAKEIREQLTQRLKECCINNPEGEVDVQLGANHSKRFYVIGGVGKPGEYPLDRDDLTVMEALSSVGGIHEFAKKTKIRIMRGNEKPILFNYKDVSRGRHMEQDIVIQNGDRIYVDE